MATPAEIKAYVARLREAAKGGGKEADALSGTFSQSELAERAARAYDPAEIAKEYAAGKPDAMQEYIRGLKMKPGFTLKDVKDAEGGGFSNFMAALGEGADPTGLYAPLYDPEFESSYGRVGANILGAVGSTFAMGPLGKIKYLPKAAKAVLGSKLFSRAFNAAQNLSALESEEGQYGYAPAGLGTKLALAGSGAISDSLRVPGKLASKYLGAAAAPVMGTVATGIDTGAQILPSHQLAESYPGMNPLSAYVQQIRDVQASQEIPSGDKSKAIAAMIGIPAVALATPSALHALGSMRKTRTPTPIPETGAEQPPASAAAVPPQRRELTTPAPEGAFRSTAEDAAKVAKGSEIYSVIQKISEIEPSHVKQAPEINTIMPDGSKVPLLGYRGRNRVVTGDTHENINAVRANPQVMRLRLGDKADEVVIDPGFMPGHAPGTLEAGGFSKDGNMYWVVGHNPDNGNLLVYDPKTRSRYEGPPEAFPGAERIQAPIDRSEAEAAAKRQADIEKGKRKAANAALLRQLPAQPHTNPTFTDLDRAVLELKKRMGYEPLMPSHNKFGE